MGNSEFQGVKFDVSVKDFQHCAVFETFNNVFFAFFFAHVLQFNFSRC